MTSLPTGTPSITGLVVSVGISSATDSPLSSEEVAYLESVVAQAYGVSTEELSTVVEYVTSGTLTVDVPADVSSDEVISDLTEALSEALGVSPEDVELVYDASTGEVTYTVTSASFEEADAALSTLQASSFVESIEALTETVSVTSVSPSAEISADVTVVVDADEVTVPLQQAENAVDVLLGTDYTSSSEGINSCHLLRSTFLSELCYFCSFRISDSNANARTKFYSSKCYTDNHGFCCFRRTFETSDGIAD